MGAFLTAARAPRKAFDMIITGIPGDLSLAHLAGMFASSQAGGALDYSGYHSPAIDAGIVRAAHATSEEERRAAWADVQRALDADLPVAWIYHARGVQGLRRRLAGVTMDLRGELATVARWSVSATPARVASRP
jgi:peptide/nickel transport system substrate-binding protein